MKINWWTVGGIGLALAGLVFNNVKGKHDDKIADERETRKINEAVEKHFKDYPQIAGPSNDD